jgi:hypothetical protein
MLATRLLALLWLLTARASAQDDTTTAVAFEDELNILPSYTWLSSVLGMSNQFSSIDTMYQDQDIHSRVLKGSKAGSPPKDSPPKDAMKGAMGGMGSKGGRPVKGSAKCEKLDVWIDKREVRKNVITTSTSYAYSVNFYGKGSTKRLGTWYETVTFTNKQGTTGTGQTILTFNRNSMLTMANVIGQKKLPILGGSGSYGRCPGGSADVVKDSTFIVYFEITICNTC